MEMTKVKQQQLMRLLHGELPPDEAHRLERELERDGELRSAHDRLARAWDALELPVSEVPVGFSASVMAAAGKLREGELSWSLAPAWARGGAAAALAMGLLLGAASGMRLGGTTAEVLHLTPAGESGMQIADAQADSVPLSLAEIYWLSLEEKSDLTGEEAAAEVVR